MAASTSMIERVYPPLSCELRFSLITITPAARPSASQVAQRPQGVALTQRRHTDAHSFCVGTRCADLPSGERLKHVFSLCSTGDAVWSMRIT